jgi:uncharacterized protein (DUF952 family)
MVSTETQDSVYKVFTEAEWKLFQKTGQFHGSEDDLRDGFIHLSTKEQLEGVIKRFFSDKTPLYLAKFSSPGFLERLNWERSASGEIYPHLYGFSIQLGDLIDFDKYS